VANPGSVGQDAGDARNLLVRLVGWGGLLACVVGGLLWALSPIGVHLSELKFHTPGVFWKVYWPAPLLILLGLAGLRARQSGRPGPLRKAGLFVAAVGLIMVIAGDIGLYWLGIDDVFIVAAPAYRAFRLGLLAFAAGSILFAVGAALDSRTGRLSHSGLSGRVSVMVHTARVETDAEQHGDEHDRACQAGYPLKHTANRDDPDRSKGD
jgi:hypothetical protein